MLTRFLIYSFGSSSTATVFTRKPSFAALTDSHIQHFRSILPSSSIITDPTAL